MRKFLSFDKIKKFDQAYAPIKALDHASNLCRALSFSISSLVSVRCYQTGFYRFSSDFGKWIESNLEARRNLFIRGGGGRGHPSLPLGSLTHRFFRSEKKHEKFSLGTVSVGSRSILNQLFFCTFFDP